MNTCAAKSSDGSSSVESVPLLNMYSIVSPKMKNCFCQFVSGSLSISSEILSSKNTLNESYTISNSYYRNGHLTVINEENSECDYDVNMTYLKSFDEVTNSSGCEKMSCTDQDMFISVSPEHNKEIKDGIEEYDSDESLGLLSDLLEDLDCDGFIFYKDEFKGDPNTTANVSYKDVGKFSDCLNRELKHTAKELIISPICNKTDISFTQAESPVYCDESMPKYASTPKYESNYSYVIDEEITSPQNMNNFHLNKKISDHSEEKDLENFLNKTTVIETVLNSSITNMPVSTFSKSDENINPQQNILNITCNMAMPMDIYDENINPQQNILNITCNRTMPMDTDEVSLNRTFEKLNVSVDKCVLPTSISHSEPYHTSKSNIPNKAFEYHHSTEFDPDLSKENALNLTCHLDKESGIGIISGEFSENSKGSARDILNTTVSYPHVHGETQLICSLSENKSIVDIDQNIVHSRVGDILNATYEKIDESLKYDVNSETLKCITNLEENIKPMQHGTKTISKKSRVSFSARNIVLEKNKGTEFDFAKSVQSGDCFGENVTRTDSIKQTYSSFASNTYSSPKFNKMEKHLASPKVLLPKHSGVIESKSTLINRKKIAYTNPSYLNSNTVKCIPLNLSDTKLEDMKSVSKIKLKESQESLLNRTIDLHAINSDTDKTVKCSTLKLSKDKSEDMKSVSIIKLKGSQESLLNATISLSPPISDASKTVIKKPRNSMKISLCLPISDASKTAIKKPRNSMKMSEKSSFDPCELPLAKDIKSAIPSFQKRASIKISQTRQKESTHKSETFGLSSKIGSKEPVSVEERKISRLPEKTLSWKTKFQNYSQSSNVKPSGSNIATKPQSTISASTLPTTSRKSMSSLPKKSLNQRSELAGKTVSNKTVSYQKNKEQSNEETSRLPTTSRKSMSSLPRKSLNQRSEFAGKTILNKTLSYQKNEEQSNEEMPKPFPSSSKIPSTSRLPQQVKGSVLVTKRTAASISMTSHRNSR